MQSYGIAYFHIWLCYAQSYLLSIVLIGLKISILMKLHDLVCFGHSYIRLRLSIFQAIDFWALVLWCKICSELSSVSNDILHHRFWTISYFINFGAYSTDVMVALLAPGLWFLKIFRCFLMLPFWRTWSTNFRMALLWFLVISFMITCVPVVFHHQLSYTNEN